MSDHIYDDLYIKYIKLSYTKVRVHNLKFTIP